MWAAQGLWSGQVVPFAGVLGTIGQDHFSGSADIVHVHRIKGALVDRQWQGALLQLVAVEEEVLHVKVAAQDAVVGDAFALQGLFNVAELVGKEVVASVGAGHAQQQDKLDLRAFGSADVIAGVGDFVIRRRRHNKQVVHVLEGFHQRIHVIRIDRADARLRAALFHTLLAGLEAFRVDASNDVEAVSCRAQVFEDVDSGLAACASDEDFLFALLLWLLRLRLGLRVLRL